MKRFNVEKLEILGWPNSIAIEAFRKGVVKSFELFTKLIKTSLRSIEFVYVELQKFVNLEREMEKNLSIEKDCEVRKENKEAKPFIQNHGRHIQPLLT